MKIEAVSIIDEFGEVRSLNSYEGLTRCHFIEWRFKGIRYEFVADKSKEQLFIPILSPACEEIVLFLKNYPEYSRPCNVIILNANSTLRHHICPPELISEAYKKYEQRVGREKALKGKFFIQPDFSDSTGNMLSIWIGFDYDWYEVREVDLQTGKFGRCLRAARQ